MSEILWEETGPKARLKATVARYETAMREALAKLDTPLGKWKSIKDLYSAACHRSSDGAQLLRAALSDQPAAPSDLEMKYRRLLWLSHFHLGLYGDDGEMQCTECAKFGSMDYKRDPLEKVEEAHHLALLTRTSIASRPPTDQPAEEPAESKLEAIRALIVREDWLDRQSLSRGYNDTLRKCATDILAILDAQPSTPEPKP